MSLRNVAGAALGTLGLTAVANRALSRRASEFPPPLEGDHRTYRWRGFDVAYTEAGDPGDPDLLLVHGVNAAGSSHEYRQVFDTLADEFHVVAPDLPGFGHSDRPPLTYSASLYVTFLGDFLSDVVAEPLVVGSSLSGAYATEAALDAEVSGLVLVCPTTDSIPGERVWLRTLVRSPLVGQALFNLLVSTPSLKTNQADHGYYDTGNYDAETMRYEWTTAHQPGARYAPASFLSGHLDPDVDLADALADVGNVTLVWGANAEMTPLSAGRDLAETADVRLVSIDRAKLLPHVEHPAEFVDVVREWVGPD
jgi:pimeloyl-ACP methyl ester carboxylesterase